jgi:hypothetical protein
MMSNDYADNFSDGELNKTYNLQLSTKDNSFSNQEIVFNYSKNEYELKFPYDILAPRFHFSMNGFLIVL